MRIQARVPLLLSLALLLVGAGCAAEPDPSPTPSPYVTGSGTLRLLVGSELGDMRSILDDAERATGVRVALTPTGTLAGFERVANGDTTDLDAIWFSANSYLDYFPDARRKIDEAESIARSPVVLGVREPVARQLGWVETNPSWREIAVAVAQGRLTYAMTNPAQSNSGFCALVAVASALANQGDALTADDIAPHRRELRGFFAGRVLSAGSSGWLTNEFVKRANAGTRIDALISYESEILKINAAKRLTGERLVPIYPTDGTLWADYPLTLLSHASPAARTNYQAIRAYLTRPEVQRQIMTQTLRRPGAVSGADLPLAGALVDAPTTIPALNYPNGAEAVQIITTFGDQLRRPARTIYLLDVSGSMADERLRELKTALRGLAGVDASVSGQVTRFNAREQVILIPYSDRPGTPRQFDIPESNWQSTLDSIGGYVDGLRAAGQTAIYDTLVTGFDLARRLARADPERYTTVVLLTDGERTTGRTLAEFRRYYGASASVPVFTIYLGKGNVAQLRAAIAEQHRCDVPGTPTAMVDMCEVARLTGGELFSADADSLAAAFKEIRGYQ